MYVDQQEKKKIVHVLWINLAILEFVIIIIYLKHILYINRGTHENTYAFATHFT